MHFAPCILNQAKTTLKHANIGFRMIKLSFLVFLMVKGGGSVKFLLVITCNKHLLLAEPDHFNLYAFSPFIFAASTNYFIPNKTSFNGF